MAAGRSTASDLDIYEDEEEKQFKQIYKILIIGDSNVGKTALLTRFVEGRFQSAFMSTVGERSSKISNTDYFCLNDIACVYVFACA